MLMADIKLFYAIHLQLNWEPVLWGPTSRELDAPLRLAEYGERLPTAYRCPSSLRIDLGKSDKFTPILDVLEQILLSVVRCHDQLIASDTYQK